MPHAPNIHTQLKLALLQTSRLKKTLSQLAAQHVPFYWQLNPVLLKYINQLEWGLEQEMADFQAAQNAYRRP